MQDESRDGLETLATSLSCSLAPGEIVLGVLKGIAPDGRPLVDYPDNPLGQPVAALSTQQITHQHTGRQVALLFAQGDPAAPVIMGLIHSPLNALIEGYELSLQAIAPADGESKEGPLQNEVVSVDNERVVIEGKEEIVLKCGEASITLTKAGKILIRGKYLLSRSSGVNRIMGGSVQVN